MPTVAAIGLLVGALSFAVVRPRGLAEALVAVPAAALAILIGLVPGTEALKEVKAMAPTVGFLAAVLVLARLAEEWNVFAYLGALAGKVGHTNPKHLLAVVFVNASVVTAVLSLDATVVLLTPVVLAAAIKAGARTRPHLYACTHLANSASLLLPVSNLTNLLAFDASGLSFGRFAALMALPWLAVITVEYVVFRRFFRHDLAATSRPAPQENVKAPKFALAVLAATLLGFAAADPLGIHPAFVALAGAVVLAAPKLRKSKELVIAANPGFLAFVLALGVLVLAVRRQGLDELIAKAVPQDTSLLALLAVAAIAAVLANLLNNLPATLVLLPAVQHEPALVLAMLIGVNVGPNLTYAGSLATLLWRRILHATGEPPLTRDFLKLGAISVPATLLAGTAALWVALVTF